MKSKYCEVKSMQLRMFSKVKSVKCVGCSDEYAVCTKKPAMCIEPWSVVRKPCTMPGAALLSYIATFTQGGEWPIKLFVFLVLRQTFFLLRNRLVVFFF